MGDNTFLERRGFRFWFSRIPATFHQKNRMFIGFDFPNWFGVLLLLAMPTTWTLLYRRTLREPGTCERCGYDLRATPDRCPECGAIPKMKS